MRQSVMLAIVPLELAPKRQLPLAILPKLPKSLSIRWHGGPKVVKKNLHTASVCSPTWPSVRVVSVTLCYMRKATDHSDGPALFSWNCHWQIRATARVDWGIDRNSVRRSAAWQWAPGWQSSVQSELRWTRRNCSPPSLRGQHCGSH